MRAARTPSWTVCWLALLASASGVVGHAVLVATPGGQRVARDATGDAAAAATPTMTSWHVETKVLYRYAKTSLATRLVNPSSVAKEISFSAVLPQSAFISAFHIEMDGQVYDAYVKEKEAARQEYSAARDRGWTAATVVKARDSNVFTVSVNVEAAGKVTFNLTYEELLTRRSGLYHHVISVDPGQIVADMSLRVRIEESSALTNVTVPALRLSNEIAASDGGDGGETGPTTVTRPTPEVAVVEWTPSVEEQRLLREDGVRGQLVVQYDVQRDHNAAQILMSDGYFVHFYAPAELTPLKKHVVFVLDTSGSMDGAKMPQLKEAMATILSDLAPGDAFSVVLFESDIQVWRPESAVLNVGRYRSEMSLPGDIVVNVTAENIARAKAFVAKLEPLGGTNIYDALMTALDVVKLGRRTLRSPLVGENPEPLVIFLTDGQANEGAFIFSADIVRVVTAKNKRRTPLFGLAFGRDADLDFLKRLALANAAFARLIYEAGDAALQLHAFYRQVSSPLLANVTFHYEPKQVDNASLTTLHFGNLFAGGELVVAGRLSEAARAEEGAAPARLRGVLLAKAATGKARFGFPAPLLVTCPAPPAPLAPSFMERLWAHLSVQQLLDQERVDGDPKNSTGRARALELALKYSFVTSLTSLVVVKPNETSASDPVEAAAGAGAMQLSAIAGPSGSGAPLLLSGGGRPPGSGSSSNYPDYGDFDSDVAPALSADDDVEYDSLHMHIVNRPSPRPQPPPSTPATELTPASVQLAVSDLSWSASVKNATHVFITEAVLGGVVTNAYQIGEHEADVNTGICPSYIGVSHCRHLPYCVLPDFKDDFSKYVTTYFCNINGFAGVCCPSTHQPLTGNLPF